MGEKDRPSSVFGKIAIEVIQLMEEFNIALVTSGAIGFGMKAMNLEERPTSSKKLQALSCTGQALLMQHWQESFGKVWVGQALVTSRELDDEQEEKKLEDTLEGMWSLGVVPIVNENDALANDQIRVGDNDTLAARLAVRIGADRLILLSDVSGVYKDFAKNPTSYLRNVSCTDARKYIQSDTSQFGTGGLETKIQAADIGGKKITTYIANARDKDVVRAVLSGNKGTRFIVE